MSGSRDVIEGAGGRGRWRYLCFAFALTGPPGFLIRCPHRRLAGQKKKKDNNKEGRGGKKQAMSKQFRLEAARYRGTVTHARDLR